MLGPTESASRHLEHQRRASADPVVSVVTICLNDLRGLLQTSDSVRRQEGVSLEYIVIDGGSTDGTVEFLRNTPSPADAFVSEPDKGIYDAMNKGLARARGAFVMFLNAGDALTAADSLATLVEAAGEDADIVYGDRQYVRANGSVRHDLGRPFGTIPTRMPNCHQATIVRREALARHPFDARYRFAGDYEQFVRLYKAGARARYINRTVCKYTAGGASESGLGPIAETLRVQMCHFGRSRLRESVYLNGLRQAVHACSGPGAEGPALTSRMLSDLLDIRLAMAPDIYAARSMDDASLAQAARAELASLATLSIKAPQGQATPFLYFRSLPRDDYRRLSRAALAAVASETTWFCDYQGKGAGNTDVMLAQFKDWREMMHRLPGDRPDERVFLWARLARYASVLGRLFSNRFDALVVFGDMQPVENLAVQFAKLLDKPTATLQHGLYVDYGDFETVNRVNYENHVADKFLAWGAHTADLIKSRHAHADVTVLGKPQYASAFQPEHRSGGAYIYVLMDQKLFDQENLAMLEAAVHVAALRGWRVHVRFHPSNNRKAYLRRFPDLVEGDDILGARVILGHSTSMIFEAMALGGRVLQFKSDKPVIALGPALTFATANDLHKRIDAPARDRRAESRRYIEEIGEPSQALYASFFTDWHARLKKTFRAPLTA